jgi:hypothetical protein
MNKNAATAPAISLMPPPIWAGASLCGLSVGVPIPEKYESTA